MRSVPLLVLLPWLSLAPCPSPAGAQGATVQAERILADQPAERLTRLLREKVVLLPPAVDTADGREREVRALVLFEQPLPVVMDHLVDGARQREYRPELHALRLIERSQSGHVYEYELRMLLMQVTYRLHYQWDRERAQVWWALDPRFDNDLAALEGRWQLHPWGSERTLARLEHRLDLGPALPGFLAEMGTRVKLPEAMHNVRRWIDSGGRYRP